MDADDDEDDDDEDEIIRNRNRNIFTSQGPTANSAASVGFSRPPATSKRSSDRPRIATLNDKRSDEEEEDDEGGQAFYAGGSERSGQQIIGPPGGKKPNPEDYIKNLFAKAKE
jgi:hypothetical protein